METQTKNYNKYLKQMDTPLIKVEPANFRFILSQKAIELMEVKEGDGVWYEIIDGRVFLFRENGLDGLILRRKDTHTLRFGSTELANYFKFKFGQNTSNLFDIVKVDENKFLIKSRDLK